MPVPFKPTLVAIATTLTLLGVPASWVHAQGRTAANWSESEKTQFLEGCQSRATPPGVSQGQLPAYCQCVLNRLVNDQVPVADINEATLNYPRNPERWSPPMRRAVVSCLPRR